MKNSDLNEIVPGNKMGERFSRNNNYVTFNLPTGPKSTQRDSVLFASNLDENQSNKPPLI